MLLVKHKLPLSDPTPDQIFNSVSCFAIFQNLLLGYCLPFCPSFYSHCFSLLEYSSFLRPYVPMQYREIIAVCFEIHTKYINILCEQNVDFMSAELGDIKSNHGHFICHNNFPICNFSTSFEMQISLHFGLA